jgi:hypothetical protein
MPGVAILVYEKNLKLYQESREEDWEKAPRSRLGGIAAVFSLLVERRQLGHYLVGFQFVERKSNTCLF